MRSVDVIVVHENGDDSLKMSLVQDQQPIETLGTNGAHEPLRHTIRLRDTKRRANNLEASPSKYLVKTVGELLVPVANQEAEFLGAFRQRPGQLARLLCDPGRGRIRRAAREMDAAAAQFDEEEDVQTLEPDGLDGEKVDGEHSVPVRAYERPPGRSSSSANRSETGVPKPRAHGRRRDSEPQPLQFTDDAQIAPPRIVARETDNQLSGIGGRPTRPT